MSLKDGIAGAVETLGKPGMFGRSAKPGALGRLGMLLVILATLGIDTLGIDTLGIDTLGIDTLGSSL